MGPSGRGGRAFKSADELRAIYVEEQGLAPEDNVVAYCRIGERSSHTWFVLTYLLGFPNVRNYDGSWTEWGNLVGAPSNADRGRESVADRPEKLARFLALLELMPERSERIEFLISTADRYRGVPDEIARRPYPRERLVPNCESEAYFWEEEQADGSLRFHYAVENPQGISAKAMAVIIDETLSGAPPEEVAAVSGDLPYDIFGRELSMGKSMGLTGMLGMAQAAARRRLGDEGSS